MSTAVTRPETIPGNRIGPDGRRFVWGPIVRIHEIGVYQIVEYQRDVSNLHPMTEENAAEHGRHEFMVVIEGRRSGRVYRSLDSALVGAVAIRRDGINTRADVYFDRMTGGTDVEA